MNVRSVGVNSRGLPFGQHCIGGCGQRRGGAWFTAAWFTLEIYLPFCGICCGDYVRELLLVSEYKAQVNEELLEQFE